MEVKDKEYSKIIYFMEGISQWCEVIDMDRMGKKRLRRKRRKWKEMERGR
jgi:hypothetical protein